MPDLNFPREALSLTAQPSTTRRDTVYGRPRMFSPQRCAEDGKVDFLHNPNRKNGDFFRREYYSLLQKTISQENALRKLHQWGIVMLWPQHLPRVMRRIMAAVSKYGPAVSWQGSLQQR